MSADLKAGIYEQVLSEGLKARIEALSAHLSPSYSQLAADDAAARFSRYFRELLRSALVEIGTTETRLELQRGVVNGLILFLQQQMAGLGDADSRGEKSLVTDQLLLALLRRDPLSGPTPIPRPSLPLAETHLLINARDEHQIGHELSLELGSADSVDLLCSFMLWSGYIRLKPALLAFLGRPNTRLRILTTVYMGATEKRVLDELHRLGAEVRISYDARRTRLHAKAWLLHRATGHHTAFVGSSNLSASALTDGLEWNVRIGDDAPLVIEKFASAYETYWNDPAFEPYEPEKDGDRLTRALQGQRDSGGTTWAFEIRPLPFQEAILETLENERFVHGRYRNLVVAATGTGKTVIAALDYKNLRHRFYAAHGRQPTLLYLAHRRELLDQARATFRAVLKDSDFGQRLGDGERPSSSDQLFANVQSLARIDCAEIPPGRWDVVVVDEFHHAEATSYDRWLKHLTPWVLVGLTATPERGDGRDVGHWFGGVKAVELRLWDAIEQGLLAPFQYFGLKDPLDLAAYWKRGQLDIGALDSVLTGHHVRAAEVLKALSSVVADPRRMRAIGFCVGQSHARFMAEYFNSHDLRAETALGNDDQRESKIRALRNGEIQALFTVDALSEGVDVPEIDTALLLRPTDSPTVFLQQLGRGLRLSPGKRCLTVLDFIATPDREFRLDRRFNALLGGTRRALAQQVENNFPVLPAGCSIQLTEDARDVVIQSVRAALSPKRRNLLESLRRLGSTATIADFLEDTGLELGDVYPGRTLTELRRAAGLEVGPVGPEEAALAKGISRLWSLDDPQLLRGIAEQCARAEAPAPSLDWKLVLATLFGDAALSDTAGSIERLWQHPALVRELRELAEYLEHRGRYSPVPFLDRLHSLQVHCHYKQEQIICALTGDTRRSFTRPREGVFYVKEHMFDLFFVTTNKSLEHYSESTMYKDYPLSRELFHWQSMSSTRQNSERGRRNLEHQRLGITPLLFVRTDRLDEGGDTAPYLFLGPLELVDFAGERPISITWRLKTPMPAGFFERARVVA
jgi:superfamily II DNA or RNA helicase/HKD family nuclease